MGPDISEAAPSQAQPRTKTRTYTNRGERSRWRRPRLAVPFTVITGGRGGDLAEDSRPAIREGNELGYVLRRDAVFKRLLAGADVAAAAGALLLSVVVAGHQALSPLAVIVLPLVVLAGKVLGVYDRDELLVNKATIDEAPRLFQLATLFALLVALLQRLFIVGRLDPTQLLLLWTAMWLISLLGRRAARGMGRRLTPAERCLFVGTESSAVRLGEKLTTAGIHAELVGNMAFTAPAHEPGQRADVVSLLHEAVDELSVHRVIIQPDERHPQAMLDFVREAKGTGARVSLLPRILEVVGSSIEVDDVDGLTLLGVRQFGLSRSSAKLKRAFDLLGATITLVILAPLLALVALLIKSDSPGPVIFRQTRVGLNGAPFRMLKLRTMIDGAEQLRPSLEPLNEGRGLFKIAADPRITPVGRWLRCYSLDELPQLINVIRGEMSLVGPRPLVLEEDARITGLDRRRLDLMPGMTGRWQILGSARVPLPEMIKLDYLYVTGWSLWSDVKILLRTVPYVLGRRGM